MKNEGKREKSESGKEIETLLTTAHLAEAK